MSREFTIDGQKVRLTWHALNRIIEMDIDAAAVRQAVAHPDEIHPSNKYPGRSNYHYADFALGVEHDAETDTLIVLTAVWSTQDAWTADLKDRPTGDRTLRKHFSGPPPR